jgi:hypothetical protein
MASAAKVILSPQRVSVTQKLLRVISRLEKRVRALEDGRS